MEHPLDNPAWNALNSGNQNLSIGNDKARYYHPDISPFAGIEGHASDNLKVLYELSPAESVFGLVNMINPVSGRWDVINRVPCFQMVCENPVREANKNIELVPLTTEHIPQMLALTKFTNPGPFLQRTIEFGHYLGIFDGDKLVAMAGQRMNPLPFAEISAVCTHPDYLGRGYAAQLLLSHVHRISEAGQIPFLHVLNTNERAVKLYDSIGFKIRKELEIVIIKKH